MIVDKKKYPLAPLPPPRRPRRTVRARRYPTPSRIFVLILAFALVVWGLLSLRSYQLEINRAVVQNEEGVSGTVVVEPTATPAQRPSLERITPVTIPNPPLPHADTEVIVLPGNVPALTTMNEDKQSIDHYTVQTGDTLGVIAERFDVSLEELMSLNGLDNANFLQVGQLLILPSTVEFAAPLQKILPDSEMILSPAYIGFNLEAFITEKGGYLASYTESVEGTELSGIQIIDRISQRYSIGSRPLLAMLEYHSGWVTEKEPQERAYPMAIREPARAGLFFQLSWAANRINQGYYGQYTGRDRELRFKDGTKALYHVDTNPGTAAIQNVFAVNGSPDSWSKALAEDGFIATYKKLFSDPWQFAYEPLVEPDLVQPELTLPWSSGETWYFTGGPHGGWGDRSGWAALDFVPADQTGCAPSSHWATAAAPGKVIRSENGEVVIDLDGDGFVGTGWTLLYMHMGSAGRIGLGNEVRTGDPIGRPSCEGGYSTAAHLHISRRYNGQWIEAHGPTPFTMSEWETQHTSETYDGYLQRGEEQREACECRQEGVNELVMP